MSPRDAADLEWPLRELLLKRQAA